MHRKMVLGLAYLLALTGCRPDYQLDMAPARGVVTLDGKPLSAGSVLLVPDRGRGAGGTLASDGTFVLTTYRPGDGAILGKHKVAVLPMQTDSETDDIPEGYVPIPARYKNAASSGLEVEVKPGEENVFELKLTSNAVTK